MPGRSVRPLSSLGPVKQSALRDAICLVLTRRPGSTARYVAETIGVSKGSVNAVLYKYPQTFVATEATTPRWSVRSEGPGTGTGERVGRRGTR